MPTEDAYSSGHLVLSHFGTCMCSNVETNLSWTCLVSGLLNFEYPSVLLFCSEWSTSVSPKWYLKTVISKFTQYIYAMTVVYCRYSDTIISVQSEKCAGTVVFCYSLDNSFLINLLWLLYFAIIRILHVVYQFRLDQFAMAVVFQILQVVSKFNQDRCAMNVVSSCISDTSILAHSEKREEIIRNRMTNTPKQQVKLHKDDTKAFDNITIMDRLRAVSHPTDAVSLRLKGPTFPLPATAVQSKEQTFKTVFISSSTFQWWTDMHQTKENELKNNRHI